MQEFTQVFLLVTAVLGKARSSGVFEIQLTTLSNDRGVTSEGDCCSEPVTGQACSEQCRTFVAICLMHYQSTVVRTYPSCTFGQYVTPLLGGNSIDLREETGDGPYIIRLPFTFVWPNSFTLVIEVWHDELGNQTLTEQEHLILQVIRTETIQPSARWVIEQTGSPTAELTFAYRVLCDTNYYSDGCDKLCRARDDQFGHYTCSKNGSKLCLEGWTGTFCEHVVCHGRCNLSHGFCDTPFDCRCRFGWRGEYCEECVPYPDCLHGYCHEPWQCICRNGWTGLMCDVDMNYCARYRPCGNGGECVSDSLTNYTCQCPPGYTGLDCQWASCQPSICLNGATCIENESFITCICEEGFYGDRCENTRHTCKDFSCHNNGTCVIDSSGRRCVCSQGFIGGHCEIDVYECMSSPCQNGGTCRDEPGRFWCDCPLGFVGESCEISTDPCSRLNCENGGTCTIKEGFAKCVCAYDFSGDTCEQERKQCARSACANGAACLTQTGGFHCSCRIGFKGRTCRVASNPCASSPCKHGGLCSVTQSGMKCKCAEGFRGRICDEVNVLDNIHFDKIEDYPPAEQIMAPAGSSPTLWDSRMLLVVLVICVTSIIT